jgi:hypothetical protein
LFDGDRPSSKSRITAQFGAALEISKDPITESISHMSSSEITSEIEATMNMTDLDFDQHELNLN